MISFLNGKVVSVNRLSAKGASVVVDVNGIGYLVLVTNRVALLIESNSDIKIYTSLIHREDSMTLFGFIEHSERDLFEILIGVSGVGPKMGLALLEGMQAQDLISAVINEDVKALAATKGVGPKLAKKLILELKDKLMSQKDNIANISLDLKETQSIDDTALQEAQSVLLSLGYSSEEINNAFKKAVFNEADMQSSEEILRNVLKELSSEINF